MSYPDSYYLDNLNLLGRYLRLFRAIRVYKDGGGSGFVFNFLNPLAWPFILLAVLIEFLFYGISGFDPSNCGLRIKKYFRENPGKLKWF